MERPEREPEHAGLIGVITEFWQRAAGYVIDFKVGQSFGEAHLFKVNS
jgi:predicted anti-sigma-YlaC factor YlaD